MIAANKIKTGLLLSAAKIHIQIVVTVGLCLLFSYIHTNGLLANRAWLMNWFLEIVWMVFAMIICFFVYLKHDQLFPGIHAIGYGLLCSLVFDFFSLYSWPVQNLAPGSVEISVQFWMLSRSLVILLLIFNGIRVFLPQISRNKWLAASLTISLLLAWLFNSYSPQLPGLRSPFLDQITWKHFWHSMNIAGALVALHLLYGRKKGSNNRKYDSLMVAAAFAAGVELCFIKQITPFSLILGRTFNVLVYYHLSSFVFTEIYIFPHKEMTRERKKFKGERDMLAALINSITDEIWFCDASGNIILANPAALKTINHPQEPPDPSSILNGILFPLKGIIRNEKQCALLRALSGEKIQFVEEKETTRYNHVVSAPVKSENGEISGAVCVVRDITAQKITEKALRLSEERFSKIFRANPGLVSIIRLKDGTYFDVNPSWERHTGYSKQEVIGRTKDELNICIEDKDCAFFSRDPVTNKRVRYVTKSGRSRTGLMSSEVVEIGGEEFLLNTIYDTTEIDALDKELSRLDRLHTVGHMAVGIGHEIRNPMTTVRGFLQLLREEENEAKKLEQYDLMIRELDRANAIISEFLFLANNKLAQRSLQNLNRIVEDLYPELSAGALSDHKRIFMNLEDIPSLKLDQREITQMLVNLVNNALEATESGGKVTIRTFSEDSSVVLAVSDQGRGIDAEIREKIGLPFVSTKDHGTGLGLAICYSVAQRHNAKISFDTGPEGTTFFVRFSLENSADHCTASL